MWCTAEEWNRWLLVQEQKVRNRGSMHPMCFKVATEHGGGTVGWPSTTERDSTDGTTAERVGANGSDAQCDRTERATTDRACTAVHPQHNDSTPVYARRHSPSRLHGRQSQETGTLRTVWLREDGSPRCVHGVPAPILCVGMLECPYA